MRLKNMKKKMRNHRTHMPPGADRSFTACRSTQVRRQRKREIREDDFSFPPCIWRPCLRILTIACCLFLLAVPGVRALAEEGYERVAGSSSMGKTSENLAPYGMTPVSGDMIEDGEYVVGTECSSSFFRIEEARLTVRDGRMTARLTMYSSSYLLVYPGTAEEAAAAPYEDYIQSEDLDGWDTFTVPVEALDKELDLAAFSKKKKMWYPRKVLFHASDIPADSLRFTYPDYNRISEALALYDAENGGTGETGETGETGTEAGASSGDAVKSPVGQGKAGTSGVPDASAGGKAGNGGSASEDSGDTPQAAALDIEDGRYSIETVLAGGSGRASVTSPTWLTIREGRGYARLLWSSPYYDYLILDGKKYTNETKDGGSSSFTIPVTAYDEPVEIIADTTAMGDPVEINYTLTFYSDTIGSWKRVPQEGARMVLTWAVLFIVAGGIANHLIKKRRRS